MRHVVETPDTDTSVRCTLSVQVLKSDAGWFCRLVDRTGIKRSALCGCVSVRGLPPLGGRAPTAAAAAAESGAARRWCDAGVAMV